MVECWQVFDVKLSLLGGGMSSMSRSRSRSRSRDRIRSRSPRDRRMRPERISYRDAPTRREPRRAFRSFFLCLDPFFTSYRFTLRPQNHSNRYASLLCNLLILTDIEISSTELGIRPPSYGYRRTKLT